MATATETEKILREKFTYSSSVAADVWHPQPDPRAYEWWYFDALSDDGREAIVVIFLDNFIFSPRYNKLVESRESKVESPNPKSQIPNPESPPRFPALVFIYYRDGKPLYRAINEFSPEEFSAAAAAQTESEAPFCKLGDSEFRFDSAPYGSGYLLNINATLRKNRKLKATLEWLSIESDFLPEKGVEIAPRSHNWNLVAPRSDVTGSIEVFESNGKLKDVRHFRGTGYHDHNTDSRWLAETVQDWQWGRAHFTDATVVYYRYKECAAADSTPTTKLFLVKKGEFQALDAECHESEFRRNIFGLKYPGALNFSAGENLRLYVRQTKLIDASFFYLRFLSEARIKCPDGSRHEAFAITEHLAPRALKFRWLDWLTDMRIGRNGKGSFLP
jgi:carotenoid 1,2-hydratase